MHVIDGEGEALAHQFAHQLFHCGGHTNLEQLRMGLERGADVNHINRYTVSLIHLPRQT